MPIKEIFKREADGSCTLIETLEVEAPAIEDQIQEKEELLLEIYLQLEELKKSRAQ